MPRGYNEWSYEKVKSVSYLDDWISETLRLCPPLFTGGARVTPAKGVQIEGTYIPGNTNVMIPVSLIQRDPRWWQQADKFVPERFGEARDTMGTAQAPYLPFSLGDYFLVRNGISELANILKVHTAALGRTWRC